MFENQNMKNTQNMQDTQTTHKQHEIHSGPKKKFFKALTVFVIILSVFFVIKIIAGLDGDSDGFREVHTISVSGSGEVQAVPDIAKISFTISEVAPTAEEAQETVSGVESQALSSLNEHGVVQKDIKTTNSSFYPKYEYRYDAPTISCEGFGCPPKPGRNTIVGYEVRETIEVKVRDTDQVGYIIQALGALGASSLNGPNFSIDDEELLKTEARRLAIEDAKEEAKTLAKDLGVKLGKVVSFNEAGGYYPIAMMERAFSLDEGGVATSAPVLPVGENIISSNVNIVYQIK